MNEPIILVGLLKGSYMFLSDLSKTINLPIQIDVMNVKSYSGKNSTGTVKLLKDLDIDPTNAHILICEDLIDTGNTLTWLQKHLESKAPASVKICTFIRKKTRDYVKTTCSKRIRLMMSSTATLPPHIIAQWKNVTGHRVLENFISTEAGTALCNR